MEWPILNMPSDETAIVITKEIYSRAASACISDITINHVDNGLKNKVLTYLSNLQKIDTANWDNTSENNNISSNVTGISTNTTENRNCYRAMAREFMELMTYDICQGGLDAVHDLLKYRLPTPSTVLAAKDAYILCSSLCTSSEIKLDTNTITGSRSPDIDFKFGIYTAGAVTGNDEQDGKDQHQSQQQSQSSSNDIDNDLNKLYSIKACDYITRLHLAGQIETSSSSLAKYTLINTDIVSKLTNKTFIVLGCDHPLSPAKILLRIPGVTVIGIPTSWIGLDSIIKYVEYNSPDDTTFLFPTISGSIGNGSRGTKRNDGNLIVSHGPHIAQWILDNTNRILLSDNNSSSSEHEFVLVPMMMSLSSSYLPPELSVRYSASSDLIIQRFIGSIQGSNSGSGGASSTANANAKISMWMYQSSTTCMVVPPASTTKSKELLSKRPSHEKWIHTLSMDTVLTPQFEFNNNDTTFDNASVSNSHVDRVSEEEADTHEQHTATAETTTMTDNDEEKKKTTSTTAPALQHNNNHDYAIVNGIITSSSTIGGTCGGGSGGTHHVLAEMIRMWRCLIINLSHNHPNEGNIDGSYDSDDSDDDDDVTNGTNQNYVHVFAPYVPILKNIAKFFFTDTNILEPNLKIFDPNVASSLMTAIGLAGLCDPLVNRPMPTIDDGYTSQYNSTPFSMFWNGSVHGGIWNCPYTLHSTLNGYTSYILGQVYNYYDSINTTYNAYYYNNNNNNAITAGTTAATTTAFTTDDSSELESQQQQQRQNNNETIIDHVPSTLLVLQDGNSDEPPPMDETMPDCVCER